MATDSCGGYNSYMATVGVRELKNGLTRYLRRIKSGESIVVTERGRPIALLGPVPATSANETSAHRLARLAADGYLSLPAAKPLKRLVRVRITGPSVSRAVRRPAMTYLDTSALVKRFVAEKGSQRVTRLILVQGPVATATIAHAEVYAAFARRYRERALSRLSVCNGTAEFQT